MLDAERLQWRRKEQHRLLRGEGLIGSSFTLPSASGGAAAARTTPTGTAAPSAAASALSVGDRVNIQSFVRTLAFEPRSAMNGSSLPSLVAAAAAHSRDKMDSTKSLANPLTVADADLRGGNDNGMHGGEGSLDGSRAAPVGDNSSRVADAAATAFTLPELWLLGNVAEAIQAAAAAALAALLPASRAGAPSKGCSTDAVVAEAESCDGVPTKVAAAIEAHLSVAVSSGGGSTWTVSPAGLESLYKQQRQACHNAVRRLLPFTVSSAASLTAAAACGVLAGGEASPTNVGLLQHAMTAAAELNAKAAAAPNDAGAVAAVARAAAAAPPQQLVRLTLQPQCLVFLFKRHGVSRQQLHQHRQELQEQVLEAQEAADADDEKGSLRRKRPWQAPGGSTKTLRSSQEKKNSSSGDSSSIKKCKASGGILEAAAAAAENALGSQRRFFNDASLVGTDLPQYDHDQAAPCKVRRNLSLQFIGYADEPLHLGRLKGNFFQLVIRNVRPLLGNSDDNCTTSKREGEGARAIPVSAVHALHAFVTDRMHSLSTMGFLNYYGLQRFGAQEATTAAVGACTSEAAEGTIATSSLCTNSNGSATPERDGPLLQCSRSESLEERLLEALLRGASYAEALQQLPHASLLMYLHAAQALVFNQLLSYRWRRYGCRVIPGDLVLQKPQGSLLKPECYQQSDEQGRLHATDSEAFVCAASPADLLQFGEDAESLEGVPCSRQSVPPVRVVSTAAEAAAVGIHEVVLPLLGSSSSAVPEYLKEPLEDICKTHLGLTVKDFLQPPVTGAGGRRQQQKQRGGCDNRRRPFRGIPAGRIVQLLQQEDNAATHENLRFSLPGGFRRIVAAATACSWQLAISGTAAAEPPAALLLSDVDVLKERIRAEKRNEEEQQQQRLQQDRGEDARQRGEEGEHQHGQEKQEQKTDRLAASKRLHCISLDDPLDASRIRDFRGKEPRTLALSELAAEGDPSCTSRISGGADESSIVIVDEQRKASNLSLVVRLHLPPGVYCTMALRELMHVDLPEGPVDWRGF
ncbi:hypothetical protein cyc_00455 [Cyclospora cayetanensis]|uniref:TRUD domain-containing protein n=1 Tax=Cyclospora cayetanensis TaxID=88456 RepID=A0A1D3CUT9_9EIME|nr:hypothetical protein cyc_00455 [Cyclospora cayetanensis]